jgi:hypothetical protein
MGLGATAFNPQSTLLFSFVCLHGAGTYVTPSLNHAGCVITTSGVFSFLFLGEWFSLPAFVSICEKKRKSYAGSESRSPH